MSKIVGTQNCGYLSYGFSKFCGGTQNLWVFKNCGYMYSKFEFRGYSILWVFKICGCSKFNYTQILRDLKKMWVLNLVGILVKKVLILKILDTIICGYSKFVGI